MVMREQHMILKNIPLHLHNHRCRCDEMFEIFEIIAQQRAYNFKNGPFFGPSPESHLDDLVFPISPHWSFKLVLCWFWLWNAVKWLDNSSLRLHFQHANMTMSLFFPSFEKSSTLFQDALSPTLLGSWLLASIVFLLHICYLFYC